jgi:hypothetical protein
LPQAPLFGLPPFPPPCQWSRLGAESPRPAAPQRERREQQPQRPAGLGQPERLSQEPVLLEVARVLDELLLLVAEREAVAEREPWQVQLNHQILTGRRWQKHEAGLEFGQG